MSYQEHIKKPRHGFRMDSQTMHEEKHSGLKGEVFLTLTDTQTGEIITNWQHDNLIVLDAGILLGRFLVNPQTNYGLSMLAVGTGAVGNLLSPNSPLNTQRKLNTEIARQIFSTVQFRNSAGIAVAYPTNIVDFTTVFGNGAAVGPLNEMALISAFNTATPTPGNPINNGPLNYDPTIDVTNLDVMLNYLTFPVVSKANTSTLTITWRITL